MINDYTRSTRVHISQAYGWSPLYILWCPIRLLCWLYTLSCTLQEYSLMPCPSMLDCAYVQNQFWKLFLAFHWHQNIGYPLCRSSKPASCKYFNRIANRMHGCCCQLVFVIEVSLGYVQYFIYFNYCFQFTACYIVVYRITLIYHVSCHVWYVYIKNISCPSLWCLKLLSHSWWFILSPCKYCSLMWTNREKYGQFHFHRQRAG